MIPKGSGSVPSIQPSQIRLQFDQPGAQPAASAQSPPLPDALAPGGLPRRPALAPFLARLAQRPAPSAPCALEVQVLPCPSCLNLRGNPEDARFLAAAQQSLGKPLPLAANTFIEGVHRVFWLGPDEWLVVAGPIEGATPSAPGTASPAANADAASSAALVNLLRANLAGQFHSLVDLTGALVALRLGGARVRDLLAKGCTLDFHPRVRKAGQCAQTSLAKASVLIATLDEAPTFELFARASFADYLASWLARAGREYGLRFRQA